MYRVYIIIASIISSLFPFKFRIQITGILLKTVNHFLHARRLPRFGICQNTVKVSNISCDNELLIYWIIVYSISQWKLF